MSPFSSPDGVGSSGPYGPHLASVPGPGPHKRYLASEVSLCMPSLPFQFLVHTGTPCWSGRPQTEVRPTPSGLQLCLPRSKLVNAGSVNMIGASSYSILHRVPNILSLGSESAQTNPWYLDTVAEGKNWAHIAEGQRYKATRRKRKMQSFVSSTARCMTSGGTVVFSGSGETTYGDTG